MPNRILRAELLGSESWLALKNNTARTAFIACLLTVDNFGTMPAGAQRLVTLWRPYGIDTSEKAGRMLDALAGVDLIRKFEANGKPYLHIPRFGQPRRYLGQLWPLSPWATKDEKSAFEKQALGKKSPVNHGDSRRITVNHTRLRAKSPAKKPIREVALSADVWDSYSTAYLDRYGTPPVRNATVNAQLANLVARLGKDEAPGIAAYYVGRNDARYAKARHSAGLLLHDAEALRMEWATGRRSTPSGKEPTLAEKRAARWAEIIGSGNHERTIADTDDVGGTSVRPVRGDLRKQDSDDVGRHAKGGTDDDVE